MKRILVYGDSNVWGDGPHGRLPDVQQWPVILQKKLGGQFKVAQEGLSGRFAGGFTYEKKPYYSGQAHFEPIFRTASPVDLVILMLGTNDLNKPRYGRNISQIADDILWYEKKASEMIDESESMPKFIYVLPCNFDQSVIGSQRDDVFFDDVERKAVNEQVKRANVNYVEFDNIDLSDDGAHFSQIGHQQMADAVFAKINEITKETK